MKLIRALFFTLAVLLPTSWTIAHAEGMGGASGETKKKSKKKSRRRAAWEARATWATRRRSRLSRNCRSRRGPHAVPVPPACAHEGDHATPSLDRPRHPLGERAGADDHDRQRPAHLQRLPGVRAQGGVVLLLPVRGRSDPRLADVRRLAGRRAPLALRGDVGAGRQRPRLSRLHLPARRVARSRPAPRRRPRFAGDGEVLPRAAKGPPAPGEAQRASAHGLLRAPLGRPPRRSSRASRSGSRCSWRRSRICSAATSGRATGTSWLCWRSWCSRSVTSSWCSRSIRTRCASIITGGYDEAKSPEARNARPFVNLRARPRAAERRLRSIRRGDAAGDGAAKTAAAEGEPPPPHAPGEPPHPTPPAGDPAAPPPPPRPPVQSRPRGREEAREQALAAAAPRGREAGDRPARRSSAPAWSPAPAR